MIRESALHTYWLSHWHKFKYMHLKAVKSICYIRKIDKHFASSF